MHRSPGAPLNTTKRIDGAVFRTKGVASNLYFNYLSAESVDLGEAKGVCLRSSFVASRDAAFLLSALHLFLRLFQQSHPRLLLFRICSSSV